jgi:hypothetical protein
MPEVESWHSRTFPKEEIESRNVIDHWARLCVRNPSCRARAGATLGLRAATGFSLHSVKATARSMIWAPVKTPEFKCHVEHSFERTNAIYWHRLPSGIPHKPEVMSQLRLDPRKKADRTVQEMTDGLWYALRKR